MRKTIPVVVCILSASLLARADVKVGSRAEWAAFKDDPLYLEVQSPCACKVQVDGKLQGWMPGGEEARCFKLVSGRGWRPVNIVAAETNAEIAAEFVPSPDGRKMADALCSDVAARCVEGDRWRYWNGGVNIQDLQMTTSSGGSFGAGITSH